MKLNLWHGVCAAFGVAGSALSALFGGFDGALATLIVFMCIDFAMGLTVAAVFKVSRKSEGGSLSSAASLSIIEARVTASCRENPISSSRFSYFSSNILSNSESIRFITACASLAGKNSYVSGNKKPSR